MRVTTSVAANAPAYPKLLTFRGMDNPWVILALDHRESFTLIQGGSQSPVGERVHRHDGTLWAPYNGAVTLQN